MKDDVPMKKTIVIHGHLVEMLSSNGMIWSTDLKQIEKRPKERKKQTEKILTEIRKYFRSRHGL
jgi:hypothetical protein